MDYYNKEIPELKTLCKERKIKGYSTKNKQALVASLQENDAVGEIEVQTSNTIAEILAPLNTEERKNKQRAFIEKRMADTKLFDKYRLRLGGTNKDIADGIGGELRNLVQMFFSHGLFSVRKCDACNTTETNREYHRAHDRTSSRIDVLMTALRRIRADETIEINQKEVMKAFIQEHAEISLWYLCKPCHTVYDS